MANPNGWQEQHAEQRRTKSTRIRRINRRKALARGEADPIFQLFSKRLAPDFQAAVERLLSERRGK